MIKFIQKFFARTKAKNLIENGHATAALALLYSNYGKIGLEVFFKITAALEL